jgi:hypothetical protein
LGEFQQDLHCWRKDHDWSPDAPNTWWFDPEDDALIPDMPDYFHTIMAAPGSGWDDRRKHRHYLVDAWSWQLSFIQVNTGKDARFTAFPFWKTTTKHMANLIRALHMKGSSLNKQTTKLKP